MRGKEGERVRGRSEIYNNIAHGKIERETEREIEKESKEWDCNYNKVLRL